MAERVVSHALTLGDLLDTDPHKLPPAARTFAQIERDSLLYS